MPTRKNRKHKGGMLKPSFNNNNNLYTLNFNTPSNETVTQYSTPTPYYPGFNYNSPPQLNSPVNPKTKKNTLGRFYSPGKKTNISINNGNTSPKDMGLSRILEPSRKNTSSTIDKPIFFNSSSPPSSPISSPSSPGLSRILNTPESPMNFRKQFFGNSPEKTTPTSSQIKPNSDKKATTTDAISDTVKTAFSNLTKFFGVPSQNGGYIYTKEGDEKQKKKKKQRRRKTLKRKRRKN